MAKKEYVKPEVKLYMIPPEINMSEVDIEDLIKQDIDIPGTKENDDKLIDVE